MSLDYLQEAFRKLNEATFDTTLDDLDALDNLMKNSKDSKDASVNIIDTEAESDDDLKTSYIGKIICECPICHSYLFKNKDDVKEEGELINVDEECPYCCEPGGFEIIGMVAKYGDANDEEAEEEVAEDSDNEESVKESLEADNCKETEDGCVNGKRILCELPEEAICEILNRHFGEDGWDDADADDETECLEAFKDGKSLGKFQIVENRLYNLENNELVEEKCCGDDCKEEGLVGAAIAGGIANSVADKILNNSLEEDVSEIKVTDTDGNETVITNDGTEISVNGIKVSTDGNSVNVASAENSEEAPAEKEEVPTEEETPAESGDEVVVELSDEEAPAEDESEEEKSEEPEEVEADVKEIDTESFDVLGTKYLKNIYENVDSFTTTDAFSDGNTLKLEGVINFKSGKSNKTSFVFEAKDMTKAGKARFVGMNESISKAKKAFVMTGSLKDGNYMVESLSYNYTAKTPSGRSVKVNGTIN